MTRETDPSSSGSGGGPGMTAIGPKELSATAHKRPADLPDFPPWAGQLAELYFSGTTAAFLLHGNTFDLFRTGRGSDVRYGVLAEFLAEQLFGRWSLVLHYDLGRGLRVLAGRDEKRLKDMVTLANKKVGDLT